MRSRTYVLLFIVLLLIYVCLTFGLPADPETLRRYNLTETKVRLINLTIVVPLVLIWLTALYGFISLNKYAQAVSETKEGRAFRFLALGLMVLAFTLPLNSIIASAVRYISTNHTNLLIPATVTRNHLTVLFSLIAFLLLVTGAIALIKTVGQKTIPNAPSIFTIGLISLSAFYGWVITAKPLNQGADERMYYLPSWLLIVTIVIPYLIAWRAGLLTTYYLYCFHKNVKGIIYRSAFKDLARGIGVVVFVSILIQLITTSAAQLSRLNLTPILALVYVLLILYAVGFGFVARGAKNLKKLEEV